jgi:hypothetical protein
MHTSNKNSGDFIASRVAFTGSNLYGMVTAPNLDQRSSFGMLPDAHIASLLADRPSYIVWSYGTPIAWYTQTDQWVIPSLKYSVTTSRHQSLIRRAIPSWVSLSS